MFQVEIFFSTLSLYLLTVTAQDARCGQTVTQLQTWYNKIEGLYDTTGWWQSANALDSVIEYTKRSGDTTYDWIINNTFTHAGPTQLIPPGTFITGSYDDEGWWALAWINAYDYTKSTSYLNMAITIFNDISKAWDTTCNGGVWWSDKKTYKNAITNELFLEIAIRLYRRTNNDTFLTFAQNEWKWFESSGMINSQYLINDGLNINSNNKSLCTNNNGTTWTYNQGVILGGLTDLAIVTKNNTLFTIANNIANATITHLTSNNILQEPCEKNKNCDSDQLQFKGIFMRNLYYLVMNGGNSAFKNFITNNANSIWSNDRKGTADLGLYWMGPYDTTDASRQSSALDCLNSVCYD